MDGFTELAKALKQASLPAILILGGLYGVGQEWPASVKEWAGYVSFAAFAAGVFWAIGIGVGRITGWQPLRRLEQKPKPSQKKVTKK